MPTTADTGFALYNVAEPTLPVLLSVPHAGRDYPDSVFAHLRLPPASLIRLEDRYADLLARDAVARSVPTIVAHRARAWIDLNRDERDIDVEMVTGLDRTVYPEPSAKQRGGLGLIPRRLSGEGDIWSRPFTAADVAARISQYHRRYHACISETLSRIRAKFGVAILLDLHSMPPIPPTGQKPSPQFVVGDRFGKTASSIYAHLLATRIKRCGYVTALNSPYAGDYLIRQHAATSRNIHALQLEVDRSLYLDQMLREPGAGVAAISKLVESLVLSIADQASGSSTLIAAE